MNLNDQPITAVSRYGRPIPPEQREQALEYCRYARVVAEYIAYDRKYDITTQFTHRLRSMAATQRGLIRFGYENLAGHADRGFFEYPSVDPYILAGRRPRGFEAIHYIVCHELAHHLQPDKRNPHGWEFIRTYKQLLLDYPYEDMLVAYNGIKDTVTITIGDPE